MLELNKKLPIYENQTIKITLVHKILNKITKSKIEINKIFYGYIFFSRVNSIWYTLKRLNTSFPDQ